MRATKPLLLLAAGAALLVISATVEVAHPAVGVAVGIVLVVMALIAISRRAYQQIDKDFPGHADGIGAIDPEAVKRNQRSL